MDKRALLAVILSVFVLYVYQAYFIPQPVERKVGEPEKVEVVTVPEELKEAEEEKEETVTVKEERVIASRKAEDFIFKGERLEAVFSSLGGGGLKSLRLKDFRETIDEGAPNVERVRVDSGDPLPLSISFEGNGVELPVDAVFDVVEKGDRGVVYSWSSGGGLRIEKRYRLSPDDYSIDVEVSIENRSSGNINGDLGIHLYERDTGEDSDGYSFRGQSVRVNDEVERTSFDDIGRERDVIEGEISWVALENKYFITAVIPETGGFEKRIVAKRIGVNLISSTLEQLNISIPPGRREVIKCSVYSGPKDIHLLKDMGSGLEKAINLGRFHIIAEPLLRFLKFTYLFMGNYGYAIILITLIIKVVFFPLANKSYKSMKEMQKLQPKMAELREKYKDDKERMSKEVMELYRKNRVNPLGGCLPMIVQIPVFIALYNVLMNAIELRHAPFHFWVTDLSAKDPYYVTPLLMGVTMFLQQKMSPSAPDPTQQKVMMMMPVIFTFMFMNLPSGLVLYWLVNNILSIAQQYYIIKR